MGWLTLLPPIVAIGLALATRRVVAPLAIGILVGAGLMATTTPESNWFWETGRRFFETMWNSQENEDHRMVLYFTLLLGSMVGVLEAGGSLARTIRRVADRVRSRRGGQTLIGLTGLLIFFDDYANTLLIGGTMRSTADRYGISRAKLAYLVDSTAAPVAGLTLISTWVATELSYLQQGMAAAGIDDPNIAFSIFWRSIPYRFYPCLALVMVFVIAWSRRDFGPMLRAEQEAKPVDDDIPVAGDGKAKPIGSTFMDAVAAIGPVVMVVIVVLVTLWVTGLQELADNPPSLDGSLVQRIESAGAIIGSGKSYLALVYGGIAGLATALMLGFAHDRADAQKLGFAVLKGSWQMMPAMLILWFAWGLSDMTSDTQLNTGGFLSELLTDRLDVRLLPTIVFLMAGFIAFSTGTSWGTMALLTPIAVTLSLEMQTLTGDAFTDASSPLVLATFSSVLAGAIFGDHCSPLSDTTVLSSRACGCDHLLHVRTQLPYAMVVGVICVLLGTLPVAFGMPVWVSLTLGVVTIMTIVRLVGTVVEDAADVDVQPTDAADR